MTLLDALVDVTLIDEDMKSILIDDANKEISSNMTMHVLADLTLSSTRVFILTNASGVIW